MVGFKKRVIVCLSTTGDRYYERTLPWWMSKKYSSLSTLLFLSVPYRLHLFSTVDKLTWRVVKHFSSNDPSCWEEDPIRSLKNDPDAAVAAAAKLPSKVNFKYERAGYKYEKPLPKLLETGSFPVLNDTLTTNINLKFGINLYSERNAR